MERKYIYCIISFLVVFIVGTIIDYLSVHNLLLLKCFMKVYFAITAGVFVGWLSKHKGE